MKDSRDLSVSSCVCRSDTSHLERSLLDEKVAVVLQDRTNLLGQKRDDLVGTRETRIIGANDTIESLIGDVTNSKFDLLGGVTLPGDGADKLGRLNGLDKGL